MKKKLLTVVGLVLCAVLLVAGSIFGTFAYLTSHASVTNTFTVGKVEITLDEAKVDKYGVAVTPAERVNANEYKLIPNHTYVKDPTIHVTAGSEKCYLFVKVENKIGDALTINAMPAAWKVLDGVSNVYYYESVVDASGEGKNVTVFEGFTVSKDLTNDDLIELLPAGGTTADMITVTAYAIQADGFATAEAAWAVAPTTWTNP